MLHLFEPGEVNVTEIRDSATEKAGIDVKVLRFDEAHPVISGNKLYKLNYFLETAVSNGVRRLVTFGGAYSNHLVATAFAGSQLQFETVGIVRGEKPRFLSPTLLACESYGMKLTYVSRSEYAERTKARMPVFDPVFPEQLVIPEGGYHPLGAEGAAGMMDHINLLRPTHICVAIGTATTFAGILRKAGDATVIGVPVLKNLTDTHNRLFYLDGGKKMGKNIIWNEYHFGGYAKRNEELIEFMNRIYMQHHLPSDFVYTAKMLYAVFEKIKQGFFTKGSRIVCVHTGGLQGNQSLPPGSLVF